MKDDDDLKVTWNVRSYNNTDSKAALQAVLGAIDQLNMLQSMERVSATFFSAAILMRWWKTQQTQDL